MSLKFLKRLVSMAVEAWRGWRLHNIKPGDLVTMSAFYEDETEGVSGVVLLPVYPDGIHDDAYDVPTGHLDLGVMMLIIGIKGRYACLWNDQGFGWVDQMYLVAVTNENNT